MTIFRVKGDCKESSLRETSSILDGKEKISYFFDSTDEMKAEMKSSKGEPDIAPNKIRTKYPDKYETVVSNGNKMKWNSTNQYLCNPEMTDRCSMHEDTEKTPLRSRNSISSSVTSDVSNSVLPVRTILRRQRRSLAQNSEDNSEDSIDRINRLRERITGTLAEVKGVLKHYSIDDGDDQSEQGKKIVIKPVSRKPIPEIENRKRNDEILKKAGTYTEIIKNRTSNEELFSNKLPLRTLNIENCESKKQNVTETPLLNVTESKTLITDNNNLELGKFQDDTDTEIIKNCTSNEESFSNKLPLCTLDIESKKQNVTETPLLNVTESKTLITNNNELDKFQDEDNVPVSFRFIKKVRRRSIFNEEDEFNKDKNENAKIFKESEVLESIDKNKIKNEYSVQQGISENNSRKLVNDNSINDDAILSKDALSKIGQQNATHVICKVTRVNNEIFDISECEKTAFTNANIKNPVEEEKLPVVHTQYTDCEQCRGNEISDDMSAPTQTLTHISPSHKPVIETTDMETGKKNSEYDKYDLFKDNIKTQGTCGKTRRNEKIDEKKKISNSSVEFDLGEKFNDITLEEIPIIERCGKSKKRLLVNSKDDVRRASIAAIEISSIKPPDETKHHLKIKTQRRPSDSEAIFKKKTKSTTSTPITTMNGIVTPTKVKTIGKVKRPPLKNNANKVTGPIKHIAEESIQIPAATIAISEIDDSDTNRAANYSRKDVTKTEALLTTTTETLPTQLAIDDASLNISETATAVKAEHIQTTTKLDEQHSAIITKLVSPLQASEQSSQACAETEENKIEHLIEELVTASEIPLTERDSQTQVEKSPEPLLSHKTKITFIELPTISQISPEFLTNSESEVVHKLSLQLVSSKTRIDKDEQQLLKATLQRKTGTTDVLNSNVSEDNTKVISTECDEQRPANESEVQISTILPHMPELQIVPVPVKAMQVTDKKDQPVSELIVPSDEYARKKIDFQKVICKNSIESVTKRQTGDTSNLDEEEENQQKLTTVKPEEQLAQSIESKNILENDQEIICEEQPPHPQKKTRKIKKKVIIKRQQRKLSASDPFFKATEQSGDKQTPEVETLEKPIEYVTDDEEDEIDNSKSKPLKTCLKLREYQIGDFVMYGERFRKTQIRWKRGRVTERITSISYKIDVEGKEVSSHISYIKKYTGHKVNFGGKEYLEIDYEQVADEEKRDRNYSIWNMV